MRVKEIQTIKLNNVESFQKLSFNVSTFLRVLLENFTFCQEKSWWERDRKKKKKIRDEKKRQIGRKSSSKKDIKLCKGSKFHCDNTNDSRWGTIFYFVFRFPPSLEGNPTNHIFFKGKESDDYVCTRKTLRHSYHVAGSASDRFNI